MTLCLFEPLQVAHFDLLVQWLQEPHVARWWSDGKVWDHAAVEKKYQSYTEFYALNEQGHKKPIYPFIIFKDKTPVGYIQFYNVYDFDRDQLSTVRALLPSSCAALDFYIGDPTFLGKGLGVTILRQFLKQKIASQFEACYVDPERDNIAAIKTYERSGFAVLHEVKNDSRIVSMLARLS